MSSMSLRNEQDNDLNDTIILVIFSICRRRERMKKRERERERETERDREREGEGGRKREIGRGADKSFRES